MLKATSSLPTTSCNTMLTFRVVLGAVLWTHAVSASPRPQAEDGSSTAASCQGACYSYLLAVNNDTPYSGNGLCYGWLPRWPPAHSTMIQTSTHYAADVYPTSYSTRTETVFTIPSPSNPGPCPVSPIPSSQTPQITAAPISTPPNSTILKRETTAAPESAWGFPLPNNDVSSSCNNDPSSFYSACSCIGDVYKTYYSTITTSVTDTMTWRVAELTCTSTLTLPACGASTSYGLAPSSIEWGDAGSEQFPPAVPIRNARSAEQCCHMCFRDRLNCRSFVYTPPSNAAHRDEAGIAIGGACALRRAGDTCPWGVEEPPQYFGEPSSWMNYITDGEYTNGDTEGVLYGFGPCGEQVPYMYGYEFPRVDIGACSTDYLASTTVYP
jgi:hypothetical protein